MTGAILAGGKSSRMGFNKAFIEINGGTIINRTIKIFKNLFDEVFIVANDIPLYEGLGVPVYSDIFKESGSLGGIYTALFHSSSKSAFVAACDMPFLEEKAIEKMLSIPNVEAHDAIVPHINGKYHPLHAIYSKRCMKKIEPMIKDGNLRISSLISGIKAKRLDVDFFNGLAITSSIENINTGEDLSKLIPEA